MERYGHMNVVQAFCAIESAGGRVRLEGDRLLCRIPEPTPTPVAVAVEVLRRHRPEVLALLGRQSGPAPETGWPPECLAAERKFGVPSARLYPVPQSRRADSRGARKAATGLYLARARPHRGRGQDARVSPRADRHSRRLSHPISARREENATPPAAFGTRPKTARHR